MSVLTVGGWAAGVRKVGRRLLDPGRGDQRTTPPLCVYHTLNIVENIHKILRMRIFHPRILGRAKIAVINFWLCQNWSIHHLSHPPSQHIVFFVATKGWSKGSANRGQLWSRHWRQYWSNVTCRSNDDGDCGSRQWGLWSQSKSHHLVWSLPQRFKEGAKTLTNIQLNARQIWLSAITQIKILPGL